MKILLADCFEKKHIAHFKEQLSGMHAEVIEYPEDELILEDILNQVSIIVAYNKEISAQMIEKAHGLKSVIRLGTAKGNVDQQALNAQSISLLKTESPALISVAEHSFMLMLALAKEVIYSDSGVRKNLNPLNKAMVESTQLDMAYNWLDLKKFDCLMGKTLGIIGFGTVGKRLARMANAFEMKVVYHSRTRLDETDEKKLNVQYAEFDEIVSQSDYISIHLKLDEKTRGMFNKDVFNKMKSSAYLINTSRGPIVDEEDLCQALQEGLIAGAGLDVFEYEPLPKESPLKKLDNIIFTAHSAGIPLDRSLYIEFTQCADLIKKLF